MQVLSCVFFQQRVAQKWVETKGEVARAWQANRVFFATPGAQNIHQRICFKQGCHKLF